ncbi:hypothetical protein SAMN05428995_101419 [Loktanella sp. DSM 29012]|uniref:hypothetical protein n=1 Tax=Loktanella sp. DSM 29012 TaxID=1881056 RepID=UPI0008D7171E|nr:hypothetical protein [Loktanella sp. DSM 29012]SEP65694.1 hypothetical protein SAMN05428995_101419 [Loktanella sp. DSM 29012]
MPYPLEWDTSTGKQKKMPALKVGPIYGVLPFDGYHNPLTRSGSASRVSMTLATPATKGQPKVYHFDGQREMAVGLEAMLSPDVYGLEVQLPPIFYPYGGKKPRKHSFDLRVTFSDGFRRAIFVRNGTSLDRRKTQDEIAAIFAATPASFADDKIIVNGDDYVRAYRDNLLRIYKATLAADEDADRHVLDQARTCHYWLMRELLAQCDISWGRASDAVLRLVGQGAIKANWNTVISEYSRIWVA